MRQIKCCLNHKRVLKKKFVTKAIVKESGENRSPNASTRNLAGAGEGDKHRHPVLSSLIDGSGKPDKPKSEEKGKEGPLRRGETY